MKISHSSTPKDQLQTHRQSVSQLDRQTVRETVSQSYSHITLVGVHSVKQSFGGHPLDRQATLRKRGGATQLRISKQQSTLWTCQRAAGTHVGGLLVVVDVVDVPGQAEVGDLHHVVVRHQDVPGRQVPVDALSQWKSR